LWSAELLQIPPAIQQYLCHLLPKKIYKDHHQNRVIPSDRSLLDITHHSLPIISDHSLPIISVYSLPAGSYAD
jgi:hypothetical protein